MISNGLKRDGCCGRCHKSMRRCTCKALDHKPTVLENQLRRILVKHSDNKKANDGIIKDLVPFIKRYNKRHENKKDRT